jgi:hypothetical protein
VRKNNRSSTMGEAFSLPERTWPTN